MSGPAPNDAPDTRVGTLAFPGAIRRPWEWAVVVACAGMCWLILSSAMEPVTRVVMMTLCLGPLVMWVVLQDLYSLTISNSAVLSLALLACAWRWATALEVGDTATTTVIGLACDAALTGGLLFAFREIYYRGKGFDGLGLGDVKLAAAGGLLLGVEHFAWSLLAASLLALSVVGIQRLRGRAFTSHDKLAFGALLAPMVAVIWLAQQMPAWLGLLL